MQRDGNFLVMSIAHSDEGEEGFSVRVVDEAVVEHSVDLVYPEADYLVAALAACWGEVALKQQYALSQTTHVNQGITLNRGRSPAAERPVTDDSRQQGCYPQQRALSSSRTPCHRRLTSIRVLPSTEGALKQQYALSQTTHINQGVTLNRGRSPAAVRPVTDDSRQPGRYPQQRALSSSRTPCHRRLTSTRVLPSTEGALQQQNALSQTTQSESEFILHKITSGGSASG